MMSTYQLFKTGARKVKKMRPLQYIRELSVVVIGVAITFYVSNVFTESREKKEIKLYVNSIYSELEYNLEKVNELSVFYYDHLKMKELLYCLLDQVVNMDTLNHYSYVAFSSTSFNYKKGAYEMFINSGLMKSVSDKQLLLNITDAYLQLESVKESHENHMALKNSMFTKLYSEIDFNSLSDQFDITDPKIKSLFNFHALNDGISSSIREAKKQIITTLATNSVKQEN